MQSRQALTVLGVLFVTGLMCGQARSQASCRESTLRTVDATTEGSLISTWKVARAEFSEGTVGVQARLELRNISGSVVPEARFYAEYYDAGQRRCFTAIFSLSENLERQTVGMPPGETRTLVALTNELFPASEPETVRVYAVPENASASPSAVAPAPAVYRPVRIAAASRHATDSWQRLCLGQTMRDGAPHFLDLLLAEAEIDASGEAIGMRILSERAPHVRTWFREFAPHLDFRPATEGPNPRGSRTLILVRAALPSMHPGVCVPPPRTSEWILDYIRVADGGEVPWINVIFLDRPVKEATSHNATATPPLQPTAPPCLDYSGTGTEWSLNSAHPE